MGWLEGTSLVSSTVTTSPVVVSMVEDDGNGSDVGRSRAGVEVVASVGWIIWDR